ncbi:MAG: ribosome biogenesis GTPase Der [Candidatus Buchananbacteria bacterium CG10_big_fil_rev_8_21_14_0_10_42_9]|uniref:GTPase Der n=1 Tax=Candidatus Buchananbacteria bacterium CG10_big_fil_rev_8_21_14_0_10_42_9 TaxID=1974526 RepID=A0A2H0W1B0_9BACT|nr:MAG: ribosome biogenesis GTPase Der [Candidatus Buchananbacteria bacterium CG10_big_fil_rev_8_21_14_0_10_42_9]
MAKKLKSVVIIGRINVGKSTLFNRLTESHQAIVSDTPGTTRDRNRGKVLWRGREIELIDTGGLDIEGLKQSISRLAASKRRLKKLKGGSIDADIVRQTQRAIKGADLILFVVDSKTGIMPTDKDLAAVIRKLNKPTLLTVNKVDRPKHLANAYEFLKLGFGEVYPISAASGSGTGDLLDAIYKKLRFKKLTSANPATQGVKDEINVAIIGKPNVGKSSLINAILGEERSIVSAKPLTTRDPQDEVITYKNHTLRFIDTAGLRKQAKVEAGLEKQSTAKALDALKRSDVVLFVTDISEPLGSQDAHLAGMIVESHASVIAILNKWDKIEDKSTKAWALTFDRRFPFFTWVPKLFVSAKTKSKVNQILDLVLDVSANRKTKIGANELERFLKSMVRRHSPASANQYRIFLRHLRQINDNPPVFELEINQKAKVQEHYLNFLKNQLREKYGFKGAPLGIKVVNR